MNAVHHCVLMCTMFGCRTAVAVTVPCNLDDDPDELMAKVRAMALVHRWRRDFFGFLCGEHAPQRLGSRA